MNPMRTRVSGVPRAEQRRRASWRVPAVAALLAPLTWAGFAPRDGSDAERALRILSAAQGIEIGAVRANRWRDFGYGRDAEPTPWSSVRAAWEEGDGVRRVVRVEAADAREALVSALAEGLKGDGSRAGCYDPHHVLVATAGDESVQVHLCFLCNYAAIVHAGVERVRLRSFHDPGGFEKRLDALLAGEAAATVEPAGPAPMFDTAHLEKAVPENARAVLEAPATLTLLSVEPSASWGGGHDELSPLDDALARLAADSDAACVLGRTEIRRPAVRVELGHALLVSFCADARPARCFMPRHAFIVRGGEGGTDAVVVLVCFQCHNANVICRDGAFYGLGVKDLSGLQARLNGILARRGIRVAD